MNQDLFNQNTIAMRYANLLEDTTPGRIHQAPDHRKAVRALISLVHELGHLQLDSPWGLSSTYNDKLTQLAGGTPDGQWYGLAGLLVGAHVFEAERQRGFIPKMSIEAFDKLSAANLQQHLVEGFLRHYTPPTTMAGLLTTLGLHPSWGLRLAFEAQRGTTMATDRPWYKDTNRFPPDVFDAAQKMIATLISAMFDVLLSLEHDKCYQLDWFARFALEASVFVREVVQPHDGKSSTPLFIMKTHRSDKALFHCVRRFIINDFFNMYLVPAGVIRCFDDQTFCVNANALKPDYRLHCFGSLAEGKGLAKVLTQNMDAQCA